jgi:hypothetical protein
VFIAVCFALSAGVVSFSIATNDQIRPWLRALLVTVIISAFCGLTFYIRNENISKVLASNEGLLVPDNKERPIISSPCAQDVPKDAFMFLFGSNIDWSVNAPHNAIRVGNDLLSISVQKDGHARIDRLSIFDDRDNIIAAIENDKLWVDLSARRDRPDMSTLIVRDHLNREVLKIEFLNPKTIRLSGVFRYPGTRPIITSDTETNIRGMRFSNGCASNAAGTGFEIN